MQYTLRKISKAVDKALREKARRDGVSLNEAALDALAKGAGVGEERLPQRDLDDVAGTWERDRAVEAALADQRTIDEELWR